METFAPAVRMASICVALALAAMEDSHAYIHGTLEEKIHTAA